MATFGQSFGYSTVDYSNNEFGDLDITTGTFTVRKPGLYKFSFNSNIFRMNSPRSDYREFLIKLNGTCCDSLSYGWATPCNDDEFNWPISINPSMMLLEAGDEVGVFPCRGPLNEDASNNYVTRFSCVYVSDDN